MASVAEIDKFESGSLDTATIYVDDSMFGNTGHPAQLVLLLPLHLLQARIPTRADELSGLLDEVPPFSRR